MRQTGVLMALKRAMDVGIGGALAVCTAPLVAGTACAIALLDPGPVLFRQTRIGRGSKPFELYKFRTRRIANDASGRPWPDEMRMTRLGSFRRSSSLDELPQLYNVLRGEMSLVGPRPLLPKYVPRYTREQARRHEVLPGLTGWTQVNGRNALSWDEKFRLDVWYVDNWSPLLDLRILAMTVRRVLARQGISSEGHVTMPEFLGTAATLN
jgi:lipopolysaccharide/colanic/teichoic acid biosynthesis glycosyltransferase